MSKRKIISSIWNIILFVIVWMPFYSGMIGMEDVVKCVVISTLVFAFIYFILTFKNKRNEILPQIIAIIVPDIILLVEAGLIGKEMPKLLPMFEAVIGQICGTVLIFLIGRQMAAKKQIPKNTFLVHGRSISDEAARNFATRLLDKYKNKFKFTCIGNEDLEAKLLIDKIKTNDIVILYNLSADTRGDFLKICSEMKKKYYFTSSIEDMISQGAVYRQFGDTMLLEYEYRNENEKEYTAKRLLDMLFSAILLVVLSPVILICAIAVYLDDGGKVINRQKYCTKDAKIFTRYTFRVTDEEDTKTFSRVGKVLKRFGLYALPELVNVFKGEMSFVGPQPEGPEITKHNTSLMAEYSYRLWCLPGMTGYSQLYSIQGTPVIDKVKMDIMYVENHSIKMDFKIVLLSLLKIALNQPI